MQDQSQTQYARLLIASNIINKGNEQFSLGIPLETVCSGTILGAASYAGYAISMDGVTGETYVLSENDVDAVTAQFRKDLITFMRMVYPDHLEESLKASATEH